MQRSSGWRCTEGSAQRRPSALASSRSHRCRRAALLFDIVKRGGSSPIQGEPTDPMLKGRLGLDDTRVPQKSRNGLVYVERARVAVETGSLVLVFDEMGETIELPYQRINALLLGPGTTVTHDAVRHCSAHGTAIAFVGTDGTRIYTAPPIFDRDADLARRQATYWASTTTRVMVAKRMYSKRF